ncbi:MAG: hypothetical protein QXI19_06385 [Candidatus Caldarchaeum sp.]
MCLIVLDDAEPAARLPTGIPAAHLDTVAGRLSDAEVDTLLQAIEEGCERVESNQTVSARLRDSVPENDVWIAGFER